MSELAATVVLSSLRKTFGGSVALDDVDLDIRPGEIHALLGHNGAGKSTLIRCLGGAIAPDRGSIEIDGVVRPRLTPRSSLGAGIAIIYQTLGLIPALTVADNIFLGAELRVGRTVVDRRAQRRLADKELARFRPTFDAGTVVGTLPVAEQQVVAIAKAMHRRASVLVLDEPTAALSDAEARALGRRLKELRTQGLAILYVTHLLREVYELADRVTVLRDGRVAITGTVALTPHEDVVEAIAGRRRHPARSRKAGQSRLPMLSVCDLAGPRFGPVSFDLRAGEVVGIFGLLGSGRTEICEGIFGRSSDVSGTVKLDSFVGLFRSPAQAIRRGVALVPAERVAQGMLPPMSNLDNALLASFTRLSRAGVRRRSHEVKTYGAAVASLGIRPADPRVPVSALSGGNQQKVMLARWLNPAQRARMLILDEPTQGIDVGVRRELYELLRAVVEDGSRTVLITSSDPEEIVAVADRALVLRQGRIAAEFTGAGVTEDALIGAAHL